MRICVQCVAEDLPKRFLIVIETFAGKRKTFPNYNDDVMNNLLKDASIETACTALNNLQDKYKLYSQFVIEQTLENYFTVKPLYPDHNSARLNEVLSTLRFPYTDRHKNFELMGCGF